MGASRARAEFLDAGPCTCHTSGILHKPLWPGLVAEEAAVVPGQARFLITAVSSPRRGPFHPSDPSCCGHWGDQSGRRKGQEAGSPCRVREPLRTARTFSCPSSGRAAEEARLRGLVGPHTDRHARLDPFLNASASRNREQVHPWASPALG